MPGWARLAALGAALWLLAELALGAWLLREGGPAGAALLAVLLNAVVWLRFAVTLRPGAVPLITRYARADVAGLPADCEGYTRGLTLAWAVLLGGFTLAQAGPLLGWWTPRAVSLAQLVACLALFVGEHALRNRCLPQLGHATLGRTLRAIRSAHRAA